MLDNLGLHDIFIKKEPTFEYLAWEFLISLIYILHHNTVSTCGTVRFTMFNVEYEYITDELAGLLEIPYGEGALCETPLDFEWSSEAFEFWKKLTGLDTDSFEGNLASSIHNPAICVFRYLLACTIFGRENPNKINAKELLFLQGSLTKRKINFIPFMLAHMCVVLKKGGTISFGGLITSIARALYLHTKLATLEPLPHCIINLNFLKDMRLCR